jgi:uncharacterized protein (TIGR02246 family)
VTSPLAQQLQPAMKGFQDAWNRHDTKAMAATFAEDAVFINPSGRTARGRAEIQKLFEEEQRGPLQGTQFSHRLTGVREVAPGVAFVDEEATISGARDPSGLGLPDQHVHAAMLLAKQGDRWVVVEGRPYAFLPLGGPGVAPATARSGAALPLEMGTGSSAPPPLEVEDTPHHGP